VVLHYPYFFKKVDISGEFRTLRTSFFLKAEYIKNFLNFRKKEKQKKVFFPKIPLNPKSHFLLENLAVKASDKRIFQEQKVEFLVDSTKISKITGPSLSDFWEHFEKKVRSQWKPQNFTA